jgi:hypothetical protein
MKHRLEYRDFVVEWIDSDGGLPLRMMQFDIEDSPVYTDQVVLDNKQAIALRDFLIQLDLGV